MVPEGDELLVLEETEGWVKVDVEEGTGWISTDYATLHTEFVQAESKEEEEARLAKEAAEREKARAAAAAKTTTSTQSSTSSTKSQTSYSVGEGSEMGVAVAEYALQFVGNPYVYGGTSLTNGADCSGFVMSVYANFGVSLPHSSASDRSQGYAVDGLDNAQPGDLICYSGHVALYIGNGQIVHASNKRTGIIVSNANYRTILAIRRIF
jgi:cell wall-associated NlpC family hydrolase